MSHITPGKWTTPGTDGEDRLICYTDSSQGRAKRRTLAHVYGRTVAERDANAQAIAFVPELLSVLRRVSAWDFHEANSIVEARRVAADALRAVEGEK